MYHCLNYLGIHLFVLVSQLFCVLPLQFRYPIFCGLLKTQRKEEKIWTAEH